MPKRRFRLAIVGPLLIGALLVLAFGLVLFISTNASEQSTQQALEASSRPIISTAASLLFDPLYTLDMETVDEILAQFHQEADTSYIGVRDMVGQVVSDSKGDWTPQEQASRSLAAEALAHNDIVQRLTEDHLILCGPIAGGSQQIGTIEFAFAQAPLRATLAAAYRTMSITILLALLGSVLIIAVGSRSVTKILAELARAAEQIGRGDLETSIKIRGPQEMAVLAVALDKMRDELAESYAKMEQRVVERTRDLQTAAEVASATTTVLNPEELLRQVVNLVGERFDLYYVGLFLPDEANQFAVLQAGTGEAGRQMVAQGHKLEIGGDSMIGKCVASSQAGIALDVGQEAQRFDNPLLPNTRSEMALPLRSRGRAVGAMTVQSSQAAAFGETDIAVMQTMADQVAVAIDNAQLFAETQAALDEIEATQRHYLGKAWTEFADTQAISGYEQIKGEMVALGSEILPQVRRVTREQRSTIQSGASAEGELSSATLAAPLEVRGQYIGALGFQDPEGKRQWSPEEITLVEEIARQLAQAADNLRLVEETQRRAAREQLIGEIAANMRETLDIETMLKTAAQDIGAALGLAALDVRLGTEPAGGGAPSLTLKTE